MPKTLYSLILTTMVVLLSCHPVEDFTPSKANVPFTWDNATIYFLMTDRFYNADLSNDYQHNPDNPPAPLRGFMGGDIKGVTAKIKEGYFNKLGVNAIWLTPLVENIQGSVNEGTGNSFGFHGYWTRDWTAIDPRIGTEEDLEELVTIAHKNGIRILMDIVANHTGPVTAIDTKWPDSWVKTGPRCVYQDAKSTIDCTLVDNLPDVRTESDQEVDLPDFLIEKWKKEGRYEREIAELDDWFKVTGYPRTPVNYIIKWIVDLIKKYGVDGFRVDTVKHTEQYVWRNLWNAANTAWEDYKSKNPNKIIDDQPFYMVGEVYGYYISAGRYYDYGDRKVDFFSDGFHALINFDFKGDANNDFETIFSKYDRLLHGPLTGKSVVNYISSHDDGGPFDLNRSRGKESATKLLLCQGGAQIYYGDEIARTLTATADGDATLRSFMPWEQVSTNQGLLLHWQKLGKFRRDNPSVGAGRHKLVSSSPYIFERSYRKDDYENKVLVGMGKSIGTSSLNVLSTFAEGTVLRDAYSGKTAIVKKGLVSFDVEEDILLIEIY